MQKLRLLLLASGLALLLPVTGYTQSVSDMAELSPDDRRAYMDSMSPDERAAMREKWRSEREGLSDEERMALRERMVANQPEGAGKKRKDRHVQRREQWASMSEEERAAKRAAHAEKKAQRREQWESMSEEERAAKRAARAEKKAQRRAQWESMSAEERAESRKNGHEGMHHGKQDRWQPRDESSSSAE